MHKILISILIFLASLSVATAQVKVEKPTLSSKKKAFAIIIDQETYNHIGTDVKAYRQTVEQDGLPTYIISGDFAKPDDVKKQILSLYSKKQGLEGVVFIGEIPIAFIRNAQHLTTAFKMNEEKYPFEDSSVPSDRFYDDLSLRFQYLKSDPKNKLNHYYKLLEHSKQTLTPTLYSARIRYPKARGGDAYQAYAQYLQKVVRTKRDQLLDHFVAFTGAAYNSECLIAWKDDMKEYKEDFPYIGHNIQALKQLNFRMDNFMKFKIFDEMQRPEVDVFLMRKHGTATEELINNTPEGSSLETRIEALRFDLYDQLRRGQRRHQNIDSLKQILAKQYQVLPTFFNQLNDPASIQKDSTTAANLSIHTQDLQRLNTNPLYIILDACYNGSFHEDEYIAGYYIFNAGNTIAAQGNTRNVLQDKWSMNQVGLLSYGVRLGQVHALNVTLENHLFGDPTFHFGTKDNAFLRDRLSDAGETKYWNNLLQTADPIYQSIALIKLYNETAAYSDLLLQIVKSSPYRIVRLQALTQLAKNRGHQFTEAVKIALTDEYEMIARQAAIYAGKMGDSDLLPVLADVWAHDKSRKRVQYNISAVLPLFDKKQLQEALTRSLQEGGRTLKAEDANMIQSIAEKRHFSQNDLVHLQQKDLNIAKRIDLIRSLRNYNDHENIAVYLSILNDETESDTLRIAMAEALGWFNYSVTRQTIISNCDRLTKKKISIQLNNALLQTLNRLK